ncbi:MAG TPA: helix-turn-helix domain-containing protein [Streptosporangiaceae bacterium]|nr:helix-turn-helix domain-containing protein [Streptosporangiaceae bacterium]
MLQVHLTAEDLLRTKFASQPAPLIELSLALATLQRRDPVFGTWRRSAAARLPAAARPLLDLIQPTGAGPVFLDPITTSLAEGLEEVQHSPSKLVLDELHWLFPAGPPAPWIRLVATRDRQTWRELHAAQRLAHRNLIDGTATRARHGYQAELAWRGQMIAESGVQATLSALHPSISWHGAILQINTPGHWELRPGGNGLTLMPSVYWTGHPTFTWHPDGSLAIIYAALTPLPLISQTHGDPLASLLGHTRAALLHLTVTEQTTTSLARELHVSPATVSAHTKTLRAAGLITTVRAGKAVLHSITPLGNRLLRSCAQH